MNGIAVQIVATGAPLFGRGPRLEDSRSFPVGILESQAAAVRDEADCRSDID
jgi:hypothetical protein